VEGQTEEGQTEEGQTEEGQTEEGQTEEGHKQNSVQFYGGGGATRPLSKDGGSNELRLGPTVR